MPKAILENMSRVGQFVQLPEGKMRFQVEGPEKGEVVVLVHGMAGHMHIWDKNFHAFAQAGYRTVRYDIFGRGLSERVNLQHKSELYVNQLKGLLDHLKISTPINLMGLSMGGAVALRFSSAYPSMVKKLVLVDAYGIPTPNDPLFRLMKPKFVGEALIGSVGGQFIKAATARGVKDPKKHQGFTKWFTAPMVEPKSKRSVLNSLRNFMIEDHIPHIKKVNQLNIPKMIVWGEYDKVLPLNYGKKLHGLLNSARFEVFEDSGHLPHYEESARFNKLALQFLGDELKTKEE